MNQSEDGPPAGWSRNYFDETMDIPKIAEEAREIGGRRRRLEMLAEDRHLRREALKEVWET